MLAFPILLPQQQGSSINSELQLREQQEADSKCKEVLREAQGK